MEKLLENIGLVLDGAKRLVIIQADNPDGDSLASALALEQILGELGKEPMLYCGIDMPDNLKYLPGWDRVQNRLPQQYDAAILVDCAFTSLLGQLEKTGELKWLRSKPLIVLDHHGTDSDIDFAQVLINDGGYVATGELIYELARKLQWPLGKDSAWFLAASILADTLGMTTENLNNNPKPIRIMADLVELGASIADIQDARLSRLQYPLSVLHYRAELLERIEFFDDNRIATLSIPYKEITEMSHLYNPTVILDELRNVEDVAVGIGFKLYQSGGKLTRVTARIRCTRGYSFAGKLAEAFGGGGHAKAAGFKKEGDRIDFDDLKSAVIKKASELIREDSVA